MISVTVDGISVELEEGSSVLDATMAAKVYVPTLCYQGNLERFGACRLCLVEVEGFRKLIAACTTPATNGMVIKSRTPEIDSMRKTIVELLLLHHPLDCLVCDKGGECDLQDLAFSLKVTKDRFGYEETPLSYDKMDSIILRDMSKCVLCGRCVRVCDEIRNIGAIGFSKRGIFTEIGYPYNRLVHCEMCGQCLASCPVGALSSKVSMFEARPWQVEKQETVCSYCGCGCSFVLECKGSKVVKVSSDESKKHDVNHGLLCTKGRFGYGYTNSTDRIKTPMIRKEKGDELVSVSWEEAVAFVSDNLTKIKDENGADALGGLGSSRCTNEDNYLFQKFFREVIGTNNIDNYIRGEHAPTLVAMEEMLGLPGVSNDSIESMGDSDCIVVIGANPSNTHPYISLSIKHFVRNNGTKLIVIDPESMELSRFSASQLKVVPGSEVSLLNCMTSLLMKKSKGASSLDGAKGLFEHTSKYTTAKMSETCGISADDIEKAVALIADADKVSFVFGERLVSQKHGADNVRALINLAMVCGVFEGRKGCGFYPLRNSNNVQGCSDVGVLPDFFPGYERIGESGSGEALSAICGKSLPETTGKNFYEMIDAALSGSLKGMYIMGENPTLAFAGGGNILEGLKKLDFLVVQDIFMSEAAELADAVFPAATYAEKSGTFTNLERRVQKVNAAIKPLFDSLGDWEIIQRLACKMGAEYSYKDSGEIFDEITRAVPVYLGISYEGLADHGTFWPYKDNGEPVGSSSILPKIMKPALVEQGDIEKTSSEFPFLMLPVNILFHHQSGAMSSRSEGLSQLSPEAVCEIALDDAKLVGVSDGGMVEIRSDVGCVKVKCNVVKGIKNGFVFVPCNFKDAPVSSLFGRTSEAAGFRALPVKITTAVEG